MRSEEWHFTIDTFTPESLPMARLAEYLAQLARLLGERRSVHLVRIEGGSTVLVHGIDAEAVSAVKRRVAAVREGRGQGSAKDAYRRIAGYLAEDGGRARLQMNGAEADALAFPGSAGSQPVFPVARETTSISGVIVRVGGTGTRIPVLLEYQGRLTSGCRADKETAKKLANHLFEPVRLFGSGQWSRNADRSWGIDHYRIEGFEPLDGAPLSEALRDLREIASSWPDDFHLDLEAMRGR